MRRVNPVAPGAPTQPGLIVRQKSPLNLEFPFFSLSDWIVPTEQFFVRNHFPMPAIDEATWRLRVTGCVERSLELSLPELRELPQAEMPATVECAGNGRVFYEPAREGLQWQCGAVGNAIWTGVALRTVLEAAKVRPDAVEVILVGADRGHVDGGKKTASPDAIAFARSLPLTKAMADGTLLAYEMNHEPLTTEHGFPLRAAVGGWFGMAWVKWLIEVRVTDRPFSGYWQARDYFRWDRTQGEPSLTPLTEMAVKSVIARPVNGATLPAEAPCRIAGAAWSGEAPLERVELCVAADGEWRPVELLPPSGPYTWRLWRYDWLPPAPGAYTLLCRAVDTAGNVQPATQQPDRESYMANWTVPVEVRVIDAGPGGDEFAI